MYRSEGKRQLQRVLIDPSKTLAELLDKLGDHGAERSLIFVVSKGEEIALDSRGIIGETLTEEEKNCLVVRFST